MRLAKDGTLQAVPTNRTHPTVRLTAVDPAPPTTAAATTNVRAAESVATLVDNVGAPTPATAPAMATAMAAAMATATDLQLFDPIQVKTMLRR